MNTLRRLLLPTLVLFGILVSLPAPPAEGAGGNSEPSGQGPAASQRGWFGEVMPQGMRKSERRGEYVWEKDNAVMLYVPRGRFNMGSDVSYANQPSDRKPAHDVVVDGYYIDKFEVSVAQYRTFADEKRYVTEAEREGWGFFLNGVLVAERIRGSWKSPGFTQGPNHPVVFVSWNDAKAYVEWAGKRLPTEAQWEKAASWNERKSGKRLYPWGCVAPAGRSRIFGPEIITCEGERLDVQPHPGGFGLVGNYLDVSFGRQLPEGHPQKSYLLTPEFAGSYDDGFVFTAPVGSYAAGASPYGVMDMGGNVWEWCEDGYDENFYARSPAENPVNTNGGRGRVTRGGGYNVPPTVPVEMTVRVPMPPDTRGSVTGFRTIVPAAQ